MKTLTFYFLKLLRFLAPSPPKTYSVFDNPLAAQKIKNDMDKMSWIIAVKDANTDYNGTSFSAGIINSSRATVKERLTTEPDYADKIKEWEAKGKFPPGYTMKVLGVTEVDIPKSSSCCSCSSSSGRSRSSGRSSSSSGGLGGFYD